MPTYGKHGIVNAQKVEGENVCLQCYYHMLVLPTITQKKKMKEYNNMLNALHVGDEVCTVGGIIGRVTRIDRKGDMQTFTMETGSKGNKSTMTFSMNSIGYILHSTAPAVKAEAKEESKETKPAEETSSQQNTAVQAPAEDVKTVENTEEVKAKQTASSETEAKVEEKKEAKKPVAKKPVAKKATAKKNDKKSNQ